MDFNFDSNGTPYGYVHEKEGRHSVTYLGVWQIDQLESDYYIILARYQIIICQCIHACAT